MVGKKREKKEKKKITAGNEAIKKKKLLHNIFLHKVGGRRFIDSAPANPSGCQTRREIISVHVSNYENGADSIIIQPVNSCEAAASLLLSHQRPMLRVSEEKSEQQASSCRCSCTQEDVSSSLFSGPDTQQQRQRSACRTPGSFCCLVLFIN